VDCFCADSAAYGGSLGYDGLSEQPFYFFQKETGAVFNQQAGLLKVGGRALADQFAFVALRQSREDQHGNLRCVGILTQGSQDIRTRQFRQHHVENDHVRLIFNGQTKARFSVLGRCDVVPSLRQRALIAQAKQAAIVNDQDIQASSFLSLVLDRQYLAGA
jgi:hypothetical protein